MPDQLSMLFTNQRDLQRKLFRDRMGLDWDGLTNEQRCYWIKDNVHWVIEELHEMTRELSHMKHWKKYEPNYEEEFARAIAEFADALHFFINIALLLGLDATTLYTAYSNKLAVNYKRQKEGY